MEQIRPLMNFVARFTKAVWTYLQRFGRWWLATFRSQSGGRKLIFLTVSFLLACCLCSFPVALLSPGGSPTPEQEIAATESGPETESLIEEEEPTTTPTNEPETETPDPTDTAEPTEMAEPTETPRPTNTPQATQTTVPSETPRPEPTQPPASTQPPAATQAPTATQEPAPTQPPPTNTPQPEPTQPPPTEPPAASDVNIINVNKQEEYVDIRNDGGTAQDLNGWVLVSERGNQECPLAGVIEAGVTLRIWALAEDSGNDGYNCGFGSPIWNNSEPDPAVLYDNNGNEVSRFNS